MWVLAILSQVLDGIVRQRLETSKVLLATLQVAIQASA
jgi:hypothetical protein